MPPRSKRSYIHRKKYLKECITQVKAVLEVVRLVRQEPGDPSDSHRQAVAHAESIEAACWSPHSGISAEGYHRIMSAKTQELCYAILRSALPKGGFSQLQQLIAHGGLVRQRLPVPILRGTVRELDGSELNGLNWPHFEDAGGSEAQFDWLEVPTNDLRSFF
jgi:hypothetical protein